MWEVSNKNSVSSNFVNSLSSVKKLVLSSSPNPESLGIKSWVLSTMYTQLKLIKERIINSLFSHFSYSSFGVLVEYEIKSTYSKWCYIDPLLGKVSHLFSFQLNWRKQLQLIKLSKYQQKQAFTSSNKWNPAWPYFISLWFFFHWLSKGKSFYRNRVILVPS